MEPGIIAAIVGGSGALIVLASGLRVIREYQRGVVLRLGRRGPLLEPGLRYILPLGIDRLTMVDLRSAPLDVPPHEVITHDGVPVRVSAAVHLQVLNPLLAVTRVVDYKRSTAQLVHAALRDVVAGNGLRELLLNGEAIRDALARFVDVRTEPWGIGVTSVDIEDVLLPDAMQRAMARQAELRAAPAERDTSGGDADFARKLEATAKVLADQPHDVQVRFLQALSDVRSTDSTVVVVPLPAELVQPFVDLQGHALPTPPQTQPVVDEAQSVQGQQS
ncbi:MAG: SPFH domain-containing protein [Candidatus Dormibacteraeota bacterium]|nr:SPFH domain-containing protein [Candidatus Dormibacteraeota bacterium]